MTRFSAYGGQALGQLRHEFDRIFNDLTATLPATGGFVGRGFPAVNVWETPEGLHLEAEIPGMKAEQLEISVVGNELTIKGQRSGADLPNATFHRRERGTGTFTRVIQLPRQVDPSKVEANLRDGVLELRLPKSEAAKPRKIEVKIAQ